MDPGLVNHGYLRQLIALSQEQDESDLISRLMKSLLTEHQSFMDDCPELLINPSQRQELERRVHRLKNSYVNLGCEGVGRVLSDMQQSLKEPTDYEKRFRDLLDVFQQTSTSSIAELRKELLI